MSKPIGFVFYEGPSIIDRTTDILGIATLKSKNGKTGNVVQSWIIPRDVYPYEAILGGADRAVCGDCNLRRDPVTGARPCYVKADAIASVWRAYHRGRYPSISPYAAADLMRGRVLRLGSYGGPDAIPPAVWEPLIAAADSAIGYSHRWREVDDLRKWSPLMASCETLEQARDAWSRGYRTFRVLGIGESPIAGKEIACPSDRISCEQCRLCDARTKAKSIAIQAHGPGMSALHRVQDNLLQLSSRPA